MELDADITRQYIVAVSWDVCGLTVLAFVVFVRLVDQELLILPLPPKS